MIVGVVVIGLVALWALISPRSVWWVLRSWAFRHPEANEPSDLAYGVSRIGGLVLLVLAVVLGVNVVRQNADDEVEAWCESEVVPALDELSDGGLPTPESVQEVADRFDLELEVDADDTLTFYRFSRDGDEILSWAVSDSVIQDPFCR